jgi:hypothetical protein
LTANNNNRRSNSSNNNSSNNSNSSSNSSNNSNSSNSANHFGTFIAELSLAAYHEKCPNHLASWRGGQTVLSTIVITKKTATGINSMAVVALGVGTKFLTPEVVEKGNPNELIRDSHAEVLARRCFVRYLYGQLALAMCENNEDGYGSDENNESIFEKCCTEDTEDKTSAREDRPPYCLKSGYAFHLYTSLAPCGAASVSDDLYNHHHHVDHHHRTTTTNNKASTAIPPIPSIGANKPPLLLAKRGARMLHSSSSSSSATTSPNYVLNGGFEPIYTSKQVVGNSKRRLSCTDKINRWQKLGLQGGLLSSFIHEATSSMSLSTIVIGRRYDATRCSKVFGTTATRVIQGRPMSSLSLEGNKEKAVFGKSTGRAMGGDGDECLTWSAGERNVERHDGRTGLPMIPSLEVLDRLGELSHVSTCKMREEFNVLRNCYLRTQTSMLVEVVEKETGREDNQREMVDLCALPELPNKSEVASDEWLKLRTALYS